MAVPSLLYTVAFEIDANNVGLISITDTTDWAAAGITTSNVQIFLEITDPTGLVWHPINLSPPDILPNVSTNFQQTLQTDVYGNPMAGGYQVLFRAVVSGGVSPGTYNSGPSTHELCDTQPTICLDIHADCLYMYGRVSDDTLWASSGFTLVSRSLTLTWPANIPGGGPAPITTSAAYIDIPVGQLYTGAYSALMIIEATKGSTTYTMQVRKSLSANCIQSGQDLCSMLCCLEGAYSRMLTNDSQIQKMAISDYTMMTALMQQAQAQASCGHGVKLQDTLNKFYAIGKCNRDCGCGGCADGDCGDSGPTLMVPIHPGAGGGGSVVYTIVGGTGITASYNSGTLTWTISLANGNLIADLYNSVVAAGSGISVAVSGPVGSPPVYTYTVTNTAQVQDSCRFNLHWDLRNPANDSMTSPEIKGTTFQNAVTITPSGPGGIYFYVSNFFAAAPTAYQVRIWVSSADPDPVFGPSLDYCKPVEAMKFLQTSVGFSFGLGLLTGLLSPGAIGTFETRAAWALFLETVDIQIEIVKLG